MMTKYNRGLTGSKRSYFTGEEEFMEEEMRLDSPGRGPGGKKNEPGVITSKK